MSLSQLRCEIEVGHKTMRRRIRRSCEALDVPSLDLVGPVEVDEVSSLLERKVASATRGRARVVCSRADVIQYDIDKPPVFILANHGTEQRDMIPPKAEDGPTIRLLLADRQQESLIVYTDGLRVYEPLEEDDAFDCEYVVHGDGEYADDGGHANTCESHIEVFLAAS